MFQITMPDIESQQIQGEIDHWKPFLANRLRRAFIDDGQAGIEATFLSWQKMTEAEMVELLTMAGIIQGE